VRDRGCEKAALRIECIPKTVRRVRKRLKNLYEHDLEKYYRSYESYRGYFLGTLPREEIDEIVKRRI
jgi:hypothetical protein